jgi:trehalose-phosphatase
VPSNRRVADLPPALEQQDVIVARLMSPRAALFLDYDGTLTPIVDRPEQARLEDATRQLLAGLAALCPVFVVSGRDRRSLQSLVGLDELGYVGSHGFDIAGPPGSGLRHEVGADRLSTIDAVDRVLRAKLDGVAGALVERKRFTVAVHVRLVAAGRRAGVEQAVRRVAKAHPGLRVERGKMVFELQPDLDWNKGAAVGWLLEAMGAQPPTPLYIGDDLTDETAFRAIDATGIAIVVADEDRPTAATFRLRNPAEVATFLERTLTRLSRSA